MTLTRNLLGLAVALVLGVILAVSASYALVTMKSPDTKAAQELKSGNVQQPNSVVYGQR